MRRYSIPVNYLDGKPDIIDKHGPAWSTRKVNAVIAAELSSEIGNYLTRKAKMISVDFEKASNITEEAQQMFSRNLETLLQTTEELQAATKKASGGVRKAADELASGMAKVEKNANFPNLEKYVSLLERAATAMTTLAELEKEGKLDKITDALK